MRKAMLFLLLTLASASLASAQFTMTFATDVETDGSNVYNSVAMSYAPNQGCTMCATAGHTYSGTLTLQSSSGAQSSCTYGDSAGANVAVDLGCESVLVIDPDTDQIYQGFVSAKNVCSMIGIFMAVVYQPLSPSKTAHSAYKDVSWIQTGPTQWVVDMVAFGQGCPGKCTKAETTKVLFPGGPQGYSQCLDIILAGVCTVQTCAAQSTAGFCTSGPPN